MATAKTATLSFRIEPGLKEALRIAATLKHCSISNMIEVLVRDFCEQGCIEPAEGTTLTRLSSRGGSKK